MGEIVRVLPIARPAAEGTPGGLLFAVILLTDVAEDAISEAAGILREDIRAIASARALPLALPVETAPGLPDDDAAPRSPATPAEVAAE